MMLKAVLFDLDDTLIDWSPFSHDQWETMETRRLSRVIAHFRDHGHTLEDERAFMSEFMLRTTRAWNDASQYLRAPHIGNVMMEAAAAVGVPANLLDHDTVMRAYDWNVADGIGLFPEVPEVLGILRAAGLKVGIVTNAYQPMWMRDIELQTLGVLDYFPHCRISAADVGFLKPHPHIFETALASIGAQASEAVFVGDDPTADMVGAKQVGMRAVYRPNVRRPNAQLEVTPDGTISSLHDLLPLLDTWYPGWRGSTASQAS
jgi:putative hydrolase of the HAD superfamily